MAKKKNNYLWIIGAVVVLVILVGGGIGIFGGNNNQNINDGNIYTFEEFNNNVNALNLIQDSNSCSFSDYKDFVGNSEPSLDEINELQDVCDGYSDETLSVQFVELLADGQKVCYPVCVGNSFGNVVRV